jgi:tyrosine-protein kinase Etk/Wzc
VLERASTLYDTIVIDTAPILAANDALDLVKYADQTIVVVRSREASQGSLLQTLTTLEQAQATITGVVITGLRSRDVGYGYGYEYRYGAYKATPVSRRSNGRRPDRDAEPAAGSRP